MRYALWVSWVSWVLLRIIWNFHDIVVAKVKKVLKNTCRYQEIKIIMNSILDIIVSAKKIEVANLKRTKPVSELKKISGDVPLPRNFPAALSSGACNIIAEVKKCSPSKGVIRENFNHLQIASIYENNGAAAISVLTDQEFFGGNKIYLSEIKNITHLPLLRKDFIIDAWQIYETRALEGDALLLIAGILTQEELKDFIGLTELLGMYPLVEVHNRVELDKALLAGAAIIGVNNRDLNTFSTDIHVSMDLKSHVPADKIFISESGIHNREDIEILMKYGINAFLIGETLMRAEDIGKKMNEMLGKV